VACTRDAFIAALCRFAMPTIEDGTSSSNMLTDRNFQVRWRSPPVLALPLCNEH